MSDSVSAWAGRWIVASVDWRYEQRIVRDFENADKIRCFWPRQRIAKFEEDRLGRIHRRTIIRPLFPGYLSFCVDDPNLESNLVKHRYVSKVIPIGDRSRSAFLQDLQVIERSVSDGGVEVFPLADIFVGREVIVTEGPFMGVRGRLINKDRRAVFTVEIVMMNQAVSLNIDPAKLEAI